MVAVEEQVQELVVPLLTVQPMRVHLAVVIPLTVVPGSQEELRVPVTLVVPCSHAGKLLLNEKMKLVVGLLLVCPYHVPVYLWFVPLLPAQTKHQATYLTCTT